MNLLGIDFEDWYHPELVQKYVKDKKHEPRMFKGIDKILDMLRKNDTLATFFVVGELLESNPEIFDKIIKNDHEIAFHTMYHTKIDSPDFKQSFHKEIAKFSDLTNKKSKGFRAPTFSLNETSSWIIDSLSAFDYIYDSSVVPAKTDLYGLPNAQHGPYRISSDSLENDTVDSKLIEFPLLVTKFLGKKVPAGGGFYLRTLPMRVIKNAIRQYEKQEIPATFYIHSWELTPEFMPKLPLSTKDKFITYHNLQKAFTKTNQLIQEFEFTSFEKFLENNSVS